MNNLIGILGLALLILVHEAGHFYTARLVGMRPRKFYIGFPPAIAKVERKGIEYGIGAVPLGGYVKIPGMHRPAPSEVDAHFARAVQEAPQLIGPAERVKRLLAEGDFDGAAGALKALERAAADADLSSAARKGVERGVTDIADALGRDAYWRQRTWKKVAVIAAGPGTNLVFAIVMFALLLVLGPGRATTTVGSVEPQIRPGTPTPAV
jgi:membrane-associated protease RseP (regulator of RpoE activity)